MARNGRLRRVAAIASAEAVAAADASKIVTSWRRSSSSSYRLCLRLSTLLLLLVVAVAPSRGNWRAFAFSTSNDGRLHSRIRVPTSTTPLLSLSRFPPLSKTSMQPPLPSAAAMTTTTTTLLMSSASSSDGGPLARLGGGLGRRRPLLSEDDVAEPPDERVVEAVERGGSVGVIASDIATKAGVSLSLARKSLSTLATLTGGDIAVTSDGELVYSFPSNVRAVLASNSARYKALQTWKKDVWPKLFYGIRVGFGVFLFISIFAIFSTLFFVSTAGGASDRNDRDDRRRDGGYGGGYGMGNFMFDLFFPRNYFFYQPYYGYYGRVPYSTRYYADYRIEDDEPEPNIFERIFSYIFGDGNPNNGIETARLRAAAQVIRDNGGAVVAEQLAPFVDEPPPPPPKEYETASSSSSSSYVDESYVLPIVSQLGGEPIVTDDGDIVYVFPELQLSAESTLEAAGLGPDASPGEIVEVLSYRGVNVRGVFEKKDLIKLLDKSLSKSGRDPSEPIQDEELEFNRSGTGWNILSGVLGAINLGGALYLGQILSSPSLYDVRLPSYFGVVQSAYPLLLLYALAFNLIPAARFVYNKSANAEIRERNAARRGWSGVLRSMSKRVRRKLGAAQSMRTNIKRLGGGKDIVFDTRKDDAAELAKKRESDAMRDFDRLLNQDEGGAFE